MRPHRSAPAIVSATKQTSASCAVAARSRSGRRSGRSPAHAESRTPIKGTTQVRSGGESRSPPPARFPRRRLVRRRDRRPESPAHRRTRATAGDRSRSATRLLCVIRYITADAFLASQRSENLLEVGATQHVFVVASGRGAERQGSLG